MALLCSIVCNVLTESAIAESKLSVDMHNTFVKKLLLGEGYDEPKLQCNDDKNAKKPAMDAKSVWEETKKSVLPCPHLKKRFGRS